jgi:hypothetical protein
MAETECVFGDLRLGFGAKPSNHGIKTQPVVLADVFDEICAFLWPARPENTSSLFLGAVVEAFELVVGSRAQCPTYRK